MNQRIDSLRCYSLALATVLFFGFLSSAIAGADRSRNLAYNHRSDSASQFKKWMKWVDDSTLITELSVPMTHDSLSFYGGDIAVTQSLSLKNQLNAGIRAFDIRVRLYENDFRIYHGSIYQYANFDDVLSDCNDFLDDNPSETVFLFVTNKGVEDPYKSSDTTYCSRLGEYINSSNGSKVKTNADYNDTLSSMRGKIVIVGTWGGDWADCNYGPDFNAWEHPDYDPDWSLATVFELDEKWDEIKARMEQIDAGSSSYIYRVNISASSESGGVYPLTAADGATLDDPNNGMTHRMLNYLFKGKQSRTTGFVSMDFPGSALIGAIIAHNLKFAKSPADANEDFATIFTNLRHSTRRDVDSNAKDHRDDLKNFLENILPDHYWNVAVASENYHLARNAEGFNAGSDGQNINGYYHTAFSSLSVGGPYSDSDLETYLTNSRLKDLSNGVVNRAVEVQSLLASKFPGARWNVLVKKAPGSFNNWAYSTENDALYDSDFLSDDLRVVAWTTSFYGTKPTAVVSQSTYVTGEGIPVVLDGTGSLNPNLDYPFLYQWDTSFAPLVELGNIDPFYDIKSSLPYYVATIETNATLTSRLTVFDSLTHNSTLFTIEVTNVPPAIFISTDSTATEDEPWSATGYFIDPGLDVWSAEVKYNNAAWEPLTLNPDKTFTIGKTFGLQGDKLIQVKIDDGDDTTVIDFNLAVIAPLMPDNRKLEVSGSVTLEGRSFGVTGEFFHPDWTLGTDFFVDFGDGTVVNVGNQIFGVTNDRYQYLASHTYADDGNYKISSYAGDVPTRSLRRDVLNVPPSIGFPPDVTINEGEAITSNFTITDPGTDTFSVLVDYGDGRFDTLNPAGNQFALNKTYDRPGTYTVTLDVSDEDGGTRRRDFDVTVNNVTPTVLSVELDNSTVAEGDRVQITGRIHHETFDDTGLILELNLGDGEIRNPSLGDWEIGPEGSYRSFSQPYTYPDNGSRTIRARIYDEEGGFGSMSKSIVVTNSPPTLMSKDFIYVEPGEALNDPDTFGDPGADSWTGQIRWTTTGSFEDLPLFGKGFDFNHTYTEVGIHTLTVEITDDDGGKGTREQTIVVGSPALGVREIDSQLHELYWSGEFRLQGRSLVESGEWVDIEVSGEPSEGGENTVEMATQVEGDDDGEGMLRFFRLVWP